MLRPTRLLALLGTLAAVASAAFLAPTLSGADSDPPEVSGLQGGVAELAGWLGSLQAEGQLARPLPGLEAGVGQALALDSGMAALQADVSGLSAADVQDLATQLHGLADAYPAGPGDDRQIALTTSNVDATGPIYGFDLSIEVTRTVEKAALALAAPATGDKPAIELDAGAGQGVPLATALTADFKVRYDADRGAFHVESADGGTPTDASDDTPRLTASATVDDFAFPATGFSAAIGFGDVDVAAGSSFDLDASFLGDVLDPNGDGRLAFQEPGNPEGDNQLIDAELRLPPSQNVAFTRSGSVDAGVELESPFTPADDDARLTLAATQLGNEQPEPVVGGDDIDELAQFGNVRGVEVLSGLAQYATALRALQANPNADAALPLMTGNLSDVVQVEKAVAEFVDANTQEVAPGQPIDDASKFQTVRELIDRLENGDDPNAPGDGELAGLEDTNGGEAGKLTPVYDPETDLLRFDLRISADRLDQPAEDIPDAPAGPGGEQAVEIGLPQIGGELAGLTGITSLGQPGDNPQSQAKRKTAYSVRLPFVIDLSDAVPAADDPLTDGIEEFESPMPNERYRVDTAGASEITATGEVQAPLIGRGTIGFVAFDVADDGGTPSRLALTRADASKPMLTVEVDTARAGLPAVAPISTLLRALADGDEDTANDPVVPAQPNWRLDGTIFQDARGPGSGGDADDYRLTESLGRVDIAWADPSQPLAASDVTLDDTARLLKALDIVPGEPGALLGRTLDQANGLLEEIDGVFDTEPLLDKDIPFLGTSARDLFAAGRTLTEQVNAVRSTPPATLQELETALQDRIADALGIGSDSVKRGLVRFSLKNLGDPGSAPELITRLGVDQRTSEDRPVSLAVGDLDASIAGAQTGGTLHVEALTDFDLAFPITLDGSAPGGLRVLDSSGFTLSASAEDPDGSLSLQAGAGPLKLRLGDGGRLAAGVRFRAYPGGAQVPEGSEQPVSVGDFLSSIQPEVGASQDGGFDCNPNDAVEVHGDLACVALPVFLNGQPINGGDPAALSNFLRVTVDGDLVPSVQLPDGLTAEALANALLNFGSLQDGLAKLNAILELALEGTSYGAKLPLIGDQIAAGARVIEPVQQLAQQLQGFAAEADKPVEEIDAELRDAIFAALQGFLRDSEYGAAGVFPGDTDSEPSATDIRLLMLCGADKHLCAAGETMTDLEDISVDLELGMGSAGECVEDGGDACADGTDLPLDFGVPGLNLSGPGAGVKPLNANAGWKLGLGFGVNKAGFYFKDNPLPADGEADADDEEPELDLGFRVGLKQQPGDDPELTGRIGFLDIAMDDKASGGSALKAGFSTDVKAPSSSVEACDKAIAEHCTKLIEIAQIPGLDVREVLLPKVGGGLDVLLGITTGVTTGSDTDDLGKKLPKITGDFKFKWGFDQDSIRDLEPPEVAFEDVAIDPGTLFGSTLNPMFEGLQRFTKPIDPIREFIFAPIPVISDLSRLFGGGDVSFVDLAETFGDVDLALLKDVNGLLEFIDGMPEANGNVAIPIGDFKVPGTKAVGPPATPDQASSFVTDKSPGAGDSKLGAAKESITNGKASALQTMIDGNAGGESDDSKDIEIGILEQPDCVFGMLMGGDCDLFRYRPDPFEVRFDYEQSFGPFFGVLYVTVGGYAGAGGRLDVGYDTRGIRQLIQGIQDGTQTPGDTAGDLFDGVFLGDLDRDGKDVNELEVRAGITAGAKLSAIIVEAGARGGIEAAVGLNLHDGPDIDGKLRIDEIRRKIAVPFCLFDVSGRLSAFLEAYVKAGLGPFSVEKTFELARIVLLDFSEGFCPETEPELATKDGSTLRLNVGADDEDRGDGWTNADLDNDGDESFVVRQTGPDSVNVTSLGFTKSYSGVSDILIDDAGDGTDIFLFQGLKTGGAPGEDVGATPGEKEDFTLEVVANSLGSGTDSITTGRAGDKVEGGPGDDAINLGLGDDTGTGGDGNDTITGGSGDDTLKGGPHDDSLDGGVGVDHLHGDDGADRIDGGRDLTGPGSLLGDEAGTDAGDFIYGGPGGDELDGGSGEDEIHGDEELTGDEAGAASGGADVIAGGLDADTVFAGNGGDTVFGGQSDDAQGLPVDPAGDELHGNGGQDDIRGGNGNDDVFGGPDGDTGLGQDGNDEINGQAGEDTLRGAAGTDTIHGDGDDDDVFGDADDDDLFGDGGSDLVLGAGGHDDIDGGSGDDRADDEGGLFGDEGDDDIKGGAGRDDLFGGTGEDVELGDEGTIDDADPAARVASPQPSIGDADRLFGDNDADELYGEGGDDELRGGPAADLQFGNDGADLVLGQTGDDRLIGGSAAGDAGDGGDDVFGGTENDVMLGDNGTIAEDLTFELGPTGVPGSSGDDTMNGGPGEDIMHGQDGEDLQYGAEDFDRMFGDLGGDRMHGEAGADYMLGDQGTVVPQIGSFPGGARKATVELAEPDAGGQDVMNGGGDDDHMYGGAADDTVEGGHADDHMEGNGGRDRMFGASETAGDGVEQGTDALDAVLDGQDDMLGGSSHVHPLAVKADEGEIEMRGDGAQDVMTGDNAVITRLTTAAGSAWAVDSITGGVARDVELLDTEKEGAALAAVSGGDLMLGNAGNDRMYGEGGEDAVKGNDEQDYLEGNQDRDLLEGNAAQDDLIGGSAVGAQPDDGDFLHGGADADVLTGDNAVITRDAAEPGPPYNYETDRLEIPAKRFVRLLDLGEPELATAAGPDQVSGGSGADVMFGQDDGDLMSGGSEDDYMEGNGAGDRQWGDDLLSEVDGVPPILASLAANLSSEPVLSGPQGPDGQDDQIGGSSLRGHRDAADEQHGNGAADFQLGDNGELLRRFNADRTAYLTYEDANATTLQRQANRFDVGGPATASGADQQYGDGGDDYQYGQDGDDAQRGGDDNDDMYGELGADAMFGELGEDAMIGDRGVITDDRIEAGDADDPAQFTVTTVGPMFNSFTAFRPGTLHRFVDLKADGDGDMDGDGDPVESPGLTVGAGDTMRGGPDRDSIHGAFGDDVANGDAGGDIVYGDDGSDALWGGRGSADPANPNDRGVNDSLVDYVFGGHGGDPDQGGGVVTGGADVIDYRPRPGLDPAAWLEATDTDDADAADNQHHQGIDWIYGGWDRDVMQSDVAENGPDQGDRLMDWTGAYNLYTHCHASYGDDNDVRQISPSMLGFLERLAFGTGAGTSLEEVRDPSSSAYRELALVYRPDVKNNAGQAYPTTPGHFELTACQP